MVILPASGMKVAFSMFTLYHKSTVYVNVNFLPRPELLPSLVLPPAAAGKGEEARTPRAAAGGWPPQYHVEKRHDIQKRSMKTRSMQISIALAQVLRTSLFEHTGLEAHPSWRHPLLAPRDEQLSPQKRIQLRCSQSQAPQAALQDRDRMGKTHAIRVLIAEQSPHVHQDAQGKVGEPEGIQLLLHALRPLAAQCARPEAQLGSELIDATFDLESRC